MNNIAALAVEVTDQDALRRELSLRRLWRAAPGICDDLVKALQHKDCRVQWGAAIALGHIQGVCQGTERPISVWRVPASAKAAISILRELIADRSANAGLRCLALNSLMGLCGTTPETSGLLTQLMADGDRDVRAAAASWLRVMGPPAIPLARPLLANPDAKVREEAARLLGVLSNYGTEAQAAVPDLIGALSDDDRSVRLAAALALDSLDVHVPTTVPILVGAIWNAESVADPSDSCDAARALGQIGSPAVKALTTVLEDKDADQSARHLAALSLGYIGGPAVSDLADALGHRAVEVRRLAATALSTVHSGSMLMAYWDLNRALEDSDAQVRRNCAYALGLVGVPDRNTSHRLAQMAEHDPASTVREASARAVGYIGLGLEGDARSLVKALDDHDDGVRAGAAFALGYVRERVESPVAALLNMLQDDSAAVRETAVRAVGRLGRRCDQDTRTAVRAALTRAIDDSEYGVKHAASNALAAIDWPAQPQVGRALPEVVWRALDTGQVKGAMAVLAPDDPQVMRLLQTVLNPWVARLNPPMLERALYLIREGGETAHWAAPALARLTSLQERYECDVDLEETLAGIGAPARAATLDCLRIAEHGSGHRVRFAVDALANMWEGEPVVVDLMCAALGHPNVDVRILAAKRLEESCPWPERAIRRLQELRDDEFQKEWSDPHVQQTLWWDRDVSEEDIKAEIKKASARYRDSLSNALHACKQKSDKLDH